MYPGYSDVQYVEGGSSKVLDEKRIQVVITSGIRDKVLQEVYLHSLKFAI